MNTKCILIAFALLAYPMVDLWAASEDACPTACPTVTSSCDRVSSSDRIVSNKECIEEGNGSSSTTVCPTACPTACPSACPAPSRSTPRSCACSTTKKQCLMKVDGNWTVIDCPGEYAMSDRYREGDGDGGTCPTSHTRWYDVRCALPEDSCPTYRSSTAYTQCPSDTCTYYMSDSGTSCDTCNICDICGIIH